MAYLAPKKYFSQKLVLNQWLLTRFGIDPLAEHRDGGRKVAPIEQLTKTFKNAAPGLSANRQHRYLEAMLVHWQPTWGYDEAQLKAFDDHIVAHTDLINRRRRDPIEWKYFQWASLLFAEAYLFEYFRDREALRRDLNAHVDRFNNYWRGKNYETGIAGFEPEELNKLCLQNATGSGKTLLMHVNVLQFKHYVAEYKLDDQYGQVILVSPNERLSDQHQNELSASSLPNERLQPDGGDLLTGETAGLKRINVTEITKLHSEAGVQRMAIDSFGDNNLLLVDEGHRGLGAATRRAEEKGWLSHRDKLAGDGFTFEYSATFKEAVVAANDNSIETAYAKNILFDYSYRYFYGDGYGKDYRIFNIPNDFERQERHYLAAALLTFYQQLRLSADKQNAWRDYNLARPLWVFVGASVVKDDGNSRLSKEGVGTDNIGKGASSDVANIVGFIAWFLAHAEAAKAAIEQLLADRGHELGLVDAGNHNLFYGAFSYLQSVGHKTQTVFGDICQRLFNADAPGPLRVERITGDSGELLLRLEGAEEPFGLINVGDAAGLAKHLEAQFEGNDFVRIADSEFADPKFAEVRQDSSPINLLIGSRKFIEGWDCWRVSSMGLMNTGKREGSQIIQLFGRGVRLKGRDMSLMRSSRYQQVTPPSYISLLETLNVFGVGADFMETFKAYLEDEGLPGNDQPHIEKIRLHKFDPALGDELKILRPKHRPDAGRAYDYKLDGPYVVMDSPDIPLLDKLAEQPLVIDRFPRLGHMVAPDRAQDGAVATATDPVKFDAMRLSLLDWQAIYLGLERYCRQHGYANLLVDSSALRPLLARTDWYRIYLPAAHWSLSMENTALWQSLALETLSRLCEWLFQRNKRAYLEPRMELVTLNDYRANIPEEDEYRIQVDQNQETLVKDIQRVAKHFNDNVGGAYTSSANGVDGDRLEAHLFNPLLHAGDDRIRIEPVALNDSEYRFVQDFKTWLENNALDIEKAGEAFYLLRNRVFRGVGFFEAGGFWPDFILWHINADGEQAIVFADPHGLRLGEGPGSDKVKFSQSIKDIEARVNQDSETTIRLESAILSPSNAAQICSVWGTTVEQLAEQRVFFMQDTPGYLDQLASVARTPAESATS